MIIALSTMKRSRNQNSVAAAPKNKQLPNFASYLLKNADYGNKRLYNPLMWPTKRGAYRGAVPKKRRVKSDKYPSPSVTNRKKTTPLKDVRNSKERAKARSAFRKTLRMLQIPTSHGSASVVRVSTGKRAGR